ncbi:ABC transporter transmembrane domain-containing protein [uncultured Chryseobacterium sp.]|uniref:peptidase domain-containing ABC transporter n=1 Tax=uncultured Chryseobacterium sp. TaxID=259322 RepID=UPI0025FEE3D1|nr:ABC transporter transmembrane domain-containing protein [uncultured Chryseobacterium sp.]
MKNIRKTFSLQKDHTDCGVGSLQSLVRYYGGDISLETLREKSGTGKTGTTLLGLYQCAKEIGFDAEGCEADVEALIEHKQPVILHITLENKYEHYVVFYSRDYFRDNKFLIGDPAKGLEYWDRKQLEDVWVSKTCLTLFPNDNFEKKEINTSKKRKWFLDLIRQDQESIYTIIFLGIVTTLLGMAMSIFSQKLIDDILPKRKVSVLFLSIGFLSFLLIARVIIQSLRDFYIIKQARGFNQRVNKSFFSSLLYLPKLFFDTRKIGDFVARLNDTQRIQNVIKHLITNTTVDIIGILISIGFLFYYSWKLALVCLLVSPIVFYIIFRFNKNIITSQKEVMQNYGINEANYIDIIRGIDVVKGFEKQDLFLKKETSVFENFQNKIFNLGKINIKITLYSALALVFFLVIILSFSSYNVLIKEIKVGELMAIIGITSSLLGSITNLALVSIPLQEAKIAFDRMFEYASISKEKIDGKEVKNIDVIKVQQLDFRFKGRSKLLEEINLTLRKGEITCILGESGCGKTTFTEILRKNYLQESGNIIINNNIYLEEVLISSWRNKISTVPQTIQLFNTTVLENIVLDEEIDQIKLQSLVNLGFEKFIDTLPQGIMTIVGEEGVNLSGGQKQLLGWMRALYHNPEFLILDEPTSSLDVDNRKFIYNLIEKIKKDKIILIISHNLESLEITSNHIFHLKDKKLIKQ